MPTQTPFDNFPLHGLLLSPLSPSNKIPVWNSDYDCFPLIVNSLPFHASTQQIIVVKFFSLNLKILLYDLLSDT